MTKREGRIKFAIIPFLISILMLGASPVTWLSTPDALEHPQSILVIPAPHPVIPARFAGASARRVKAGIQDSSNTGSPIRSGMTRGWFDWLSPQHAKAAIVQTPPLMGRLTTTTGYNVADGNYSIIFSIYSAASGGTALWSETQTVPVTDGVWRVFLGSTTAISGVDFDSSTNYLGVKVGSDAEMSPRMLIGPGMQAIDADLLDGKHSTDFTLDWITDNNAITTNTISVGQVTSTGLVLGSGQITNSASTSWDLLSSSADTTLSVTNSNGTYRANLSVEGQIQVGNFSSSPTALGGGSLYYNTTDNSISYYDIGSASWVVLASGGVGGAPANATYLTKTANATLTNEVLITALDSHIVSATDNNYNLGSATNVWANGYFTNLLAGTGDALTITANAASTWSTSSGLLTIQGAGGITNTSTGGAFTVNAAGQAIDMDSTSYTLDTTGAFSIDGVGASNLSTTSGDLTISTITSGTLSLTSAAATTINATAAALTLQTTTSGNIAINPASTSDIVMTLDTDGSIIDINDTANTTGTAIDITNTALTSGTALSIAQSTSSFIGKLINLQASGGGGGTAYGLYSALTGAATTNVAGYFSATGATNNYGLIVENGYLGVGTATPTATVHIVGQCVTGDTLLKRRRRRRKVKSQKSKVKIEGKNSKDFADDDYIYDEVRIDQIEAGDEVLSLNEATGKFEYRKVRALKEMGKQKVYKLITKSGKTIKTTANHPYLVKEDSDWLVGGTFEVDQSNHIEQLNKHSAVAISGHYNSWAIKINKKEKQLFWQTYQQKRKLRFFGPQIFARTIVLLLQSQKLIPGKLIIDLEYPSYDETIRQIIKEYNQEIIIEFKSIGKKSQAHFAARAVISGRAEPIKTKKTDRDSFLGSYSAICAQDAGLTPPSARESLSLNKDYQNTLDLSSASWVKVKNLRSRMVIATVDGWEKIKSIKELAKEETFDIEIEGTHNFVGNEIVAHNTYLTATSGTILEARNAGAGSTLVAGDGTDYLAVNSTGDITFVDANGAASITGPAGGALTVAGGASQALTLTGNGASVWSVTSGGLTINSTSANLALQTTTSGDITMNPASTGDLVMTLDTDGSIIDINDTANTTSTVIDVTSTALTSGTMMSLVQSTGAFTGKLLNLQASGIGVGTSYGLYSSLTGASTTNVAGYFSATGATNNYGLIVENGNLGVGTPTPTSTVHVVGQCVTGDTLLKRRRRRRRRQAGIEPEPNDEEKIDLINLIDLISKKALSTNDPKIEKLAKKLGIENLDIKNLLGQLEQFPPEADQPLAEEIRNSHDYIYDEVRIDQIEAGDEVLSLNEATGKFEYRKVRALKEMGKQKVNRLVTANGLAIETTDEHPYLVIEDSQPPRRLHYPTTFQVDQSIRLETTNQDTILAIANKLASFTLLIDQDLKKKLINKKTKKHLPAIFAHFIAFAVSKSNLEISGLEIDNEYKGHELLIAKIIRSSYPNLIINFKKIGHSSSAHQAAYGVHLGKRKADLNTKKEGPDQLGSQGIPGFRTVTHQDKSLTIRSPHDLLFYREDYQSHLGLSSQLKQAKWIQARYLKKGMLIATARGWQKIATKYETGKKETYDIEIEATHNFVGNEIVAHNTYINSSTATGTALDVDSNSLTSGTGLDVSSSATAFTGNLLNLTLSGSNAANTGSLLQLLNSGTLNTNTSLYVKHYATGTGNLAMRVDDVSGDTTPFVIDGDGNVGIGTTGPTNKLVVSADVNPAGNHDTLGQFAIRGTTDPLKVLVLGVDTNAATNYAYVQSSQDLTDTRALSLNPIGGNVGIGETSPGAKLEVDTDPADNVTALIVDQDDTTNNNTALEIQNAGSGASLIAGNETDYLSVSSVGDITFIDANGAASITGPAGGDLDIAAGASQNLDLDGTGVTIDASGAFSIDGALASNVSTTAADLTISTITSGILALTSAGALNLTSGTASNIALNPGTTGDALFTLDTDGSQITVTDTANITNDTLAITSSAQTTGSAIVVTQNALTSGYALEVTTSSTAFTGALLFANSTGSGATGKLLQLQSESSDMFAVTSASSVFSNPVSFESPGDTTMAYDLYFSNPTAAYIKSEGPLYIESGDPNQNYDLTFMAYGTGNIVALNNVLTQKADPSLILDTVTATDTDFWLSVTEDAGGDDDDLFQIGDGTTPGTNPFLTINTSGNVGIGISSALSSFVELDTGTASGVALTIDQDDVDQTALDLDINNTAGDILNIDWGGATTQTAAIQGIDVDLTNLTTLAASSVYGVHINDAANATTATEYGLYIEGTNWDYGIYNADATYLVGNTGIGMAPTTLLEVGDGTDSIQFGSVGDITFVDANGAASITGPAGGALTVAAGASQALTLTGNGASVWSVTSGGLTINSTSANLALQTTTSGDITMNPASTSDLVMTLDTDGSIIDINDTANTTSTVIDVDSTTLSSGTLLDLTVNSTAAASNTQKGLNISIQGANATASQTTYGAYIANTHTGTTSTNIGLYVQGSGATNNYALVVANNNWISGLDAAGTGYVNLMKVNASDEIEVGGTLVGGSIEAVEDSGAITIFDMPVSSSSADNLEMSATFAIDGNNVFKVYGQSDAAGGADTFRTYNYGEAWIQKTDPTIVLDTVSATDTDFWIAVTEDAGGDDDDLFQIGDGTTTGTNPFLTIDTSGQVGIGDVSPSAKLEVGDGTDSIQFGSAGDITFVDANGVASITGPAGGILTLQAANSQNLALATQTAGDITLTTAATTGLVNILTGNLKVGNGTPDVALDAEDAYIEGTLEVDSRIKMDTWTADGDTIVYKDDVTGNLGLVTSDIRLKKDITPLNSSLSKISRLQGFLYHDLTDQSTDKKRLGLSAQDVMAVLPEAAFTFTNQNGQQYYSIHYEKLTALLVEGVKELSNLAQNESDQISDLQNAITDLNTQLANHINNQQLTVTDAIINKDLQVKGQAIFEGIEVLENAKISGNLEVAQEILTKDLTISNTLTVGNSNDFAKFDQNGLLTFAGLARPIRTISLAPEYPAAIKKTYPNGQGTLTADYEITQLDNHAFYNWTSDQANYQEYEVSVRIYLPKNFSQWNLTDPFNINAWTDDFLNTFLDATVYDSKGELDPAITFANLIPDTDLTWQTINLTPSGTYTPDSWITLVLHYSASNKANVRTGEITMDYLSSN